MSFDGYLRFVFALVFVLGLIGLFVFIARRFNLTPRVTDTKTNRRLRIVEILPVDAKRRLILVRRDEVEHLILLGATNEAIIEGGITATAANPESPR